MISRLSAGAASGRAATAEKTLEKLTADGVKVPFCCIQLVWNLAIQRNREYAGEAGCREREGVLQFLSQPCVSVLFHCIPRFQVSCNSTPIFQDPLLFQGSNNAATARQVLHETTILDVCRSRSPSCRRSALSSSRPSSAWARSPSKSTTSRTGASLACSFSALWTCMRLHDLGTAARPATNPCIALAVYPAERLSQNGAVHHKSLIFLLLRLQVPGPAAV